MAASTIRSGVGKSGSPAPKPMTFSPAALSALALASTASVADSSMAAIRAEMRPTAPSSRTARRHPGANSGPEPPWSARIRRRPYPVSAAGASSLVRRMHGHAGGARRGLPRMISAFLGIAVLVAGVVTVLGAPAGAQTETLPPPQAYILVDAKTGAVITARHMHTALPPASTVKI